MERENESKNLSEQLEAFRQQWKEELKNSANNSPATTRAASPAPPKNRPAQETGTNCNDDKIQQAKTLFLKGVEYEQLHNTAAALVFYRQAVKLVPDIESYISEYAYYPAAGNEQESKTGQGVAEEDPGLVEVEECSLLSDFVEEFQKLAVVEGNKICQPQYEMRGTHISSLPVEVLLYIFKWVVSSDVDMLSLERLAMVCKGFYALARDPDIWRVASLRTWGLKSGESADSWNGCWRTMFINRPRLQCNGVYISKCAYVRQGDSCSFGMASPLFQVVEYYRYLRFFLDGYVLAFTTADEPAVIVPHLKNKNQNISSVNLGVYSLMDDKVNVIIEKKEYDVARGHGGRRRVPQPTSVNTFNMELGLRNTKKRRNAKLEWIQYTCHTFHRSTGQSIVSQYDLTHQFTPFFFSRVKSFTDYSLAPV